MLTQVVYMGINIVLPAYFYNIFGLSLASSAGMSVIFTVTGVLGQLIWPSLSDVIGRKTTLVICGLWMAVSVGVFQLAGTIRLVIEVQLLFGLVANAVWPIYYAAASDAAPPAATSTANGIITTAMFVGGGISPALMGVLIAWGGGWTQARGYLLCFDAMAASATAGVLLQFLAVQPVSTPALTEHR
jgi:MFS family permease